MLRELETSEIIEALQKALHQYANPENWEGNKFLVAEDCCKDDCAGLFLYNGELARQALRYNKSMMKAY